MTIDLLHTLVHSMSKSEKRYCRLAMGHQTGEKGFLRLFECLVKHQAPDQEMTNELSELLPAATIEPARKHLYRVLMQNLRQFEQNKRIDVRISQLLHDSQILYERGLIQFSHQQLEKALALSEKHERGLYAVLAGRQQIEQWVRWQFDGIDEPVLASKHEMIRRQLERSQTAMQHAALYETLLLRYRTQGMAGSASDRRRLDDLLLEEHQMLNRQKQRSFSMQERHLHFQSAYFRMLGDGAGSLRIYEELDILFQKNPMLWSEEPLYYVQLLEGILTDLRLLEEHDRMPYFIERLALIDTSVQGLNRIIPNLVLYYSMLMLVDKGQYSDAASLLGRHVSDLQGFERALAQLPVPARIEFEFLLVRIDIAQGRLPAALQKLNKILTPSARWLPRSLYAQCRLMNLLLHMRLGNSDYLQYALRSAERKLTANGSAGEKQIILFVRQWLAGKLSADAFKELRQFGGSPADRQLFRNLDVFQCITAMVPPILNTLLIFLR